MILFTACWLLRLLLLAVLVVLSAGVATAGAILVGATCGVAAWRVAGHGPPDWADGQHQ